MRHLLKITLAYTILLHTLHTVCAEELPLECEGAIEKVRYVRISLPSDKKEALTLNEVEVISNGENIARNGRASQSSTGYGGIAYRAIDGRRDPIYSLDGNPGQTHTIHTAGSWWELDLGAEFSVAQIRIWNRERKFAHRLNGFALQLLDSKRHEVFGRIASAAPDGEIAFCFDAQVIAYRDHAGQPNAPMPWDAGALANAQHHRDPSPFAFRQGDRIALLGNGLADRMQHAGWVEALLHQHTPGMQLTFRNMSVSGDRPGSYPRSKGFTPMVPYLQHVQADVLLCFFGYNESFGKAEKLAEYQNQLTKMIQTMRAAQPNGESTPRIVLVSPIPHENLENPNLPDGQENNKNLKLYTDGMAKVAQQYGVGFIDLYTPMRRVYDQERAPLTINGVHLNDEGYRHLSGIIAQALLHQDVSAAKDDERLLEIKAAVLDKNWHWHNRYRATDGNDIWGSRGRLAFVNKQTNAQVLTHELTMLDQMTANRDQKIWATAQGKPYTVDDANVARPLPVISNHGMRDDSARKEGDGGYQTGVQAMSKLTMPEGFALNLFADEGMFPELVNPVQMQVDAQGRLWAAAWRTYPKWEPLKEMNDALLILHDDDNDGKADRCTEFARVHNPVGFEFWNGGVIVSCQPDILFLKDTDGDDIADVRQVLVQGVGSADTHHAANNFCYGPDGAIYWESGYFLVNNIEHPWGPSLHTGASGVYRFDPRRYTITFHAGGYSPNPHGTAFDYWGYHYAQDGTGGQSAQVRRTKHGFDSAPLAKRLVRPVSSCTILSSANFPDEWQQNYLITNVIGFLGIKHYHLHRDGFPSKDYHFGEVWGTPTVDLLQSSDTNFRPSDLVFGTDGSLYIADWHNALIGHMQHNIRDPKRDKTHGRIYRMVHTAKPLQEPVHIAGAPIPDLLENLKHPIDGVRHRTRVELSARPTSQVMPALTDWITTLDPRGKQDAHHLLEALWLRQQHNVRDLDLLETLLASPEPHAVEAARTVQHHWTVADPVATQHSPPAVQPVHKAPKVHVPSHLVHEERELYKLGAEIYQRESHCATCHQDDGEGVGEIYPPLNQSEWVTTDVDRLIKLTLHGIWGEIEVNGKLYDPKKGVPPMTAFHSILDDTEVAAVLTYVRNQWSNKSPAITPAQVSKVRAQVTNRNTFWQVEELLKLHPMAK